MIGWTNAQKQRLLELGVSRDKIESFFESEVERNSCYQQIEQELVCRGKAQLLDYRDLIKRPALLDLESQLVKVLTGSGFAQVVTPLLLSKGLLAKMSITEDHSLFKQVFWVGDRKCLRPMLAPNLYFILKDLLRLWQHPVSIFEIGPCFRKDTEGGKHLQEFTMLNLVEMGLPVKERLARLKDLVSLVMVAAGLDGYTLETDSSDVYGETVDIVSDELELGSGAMGPHVLDQQWEITVPWVGIGFGLERLVMIKEGHNSIQKAGRSLTYLNGVRLNL